MCLLVHSTIAHEIFIEMNNNIKILRKKNQWNCYHSSRSNYHQNLIGLLRLMCSMQCSALTRKFKRKKNFECTFQNDCMNLSRPELQEIIIYFEFSPKRKSMKAIFINSKHLKITFYDFLSHYHFIFIWIWVFCACLPFPSGFSQFIRAIHTQRYM